MYKAIKYWVVLVKKMYTELKFRFDTAEGAEDFYKLIGETYFDNESKEEDKKKFYVKIYAIIDEEDENNGMGF